MCPHMEQGIEIAQLDLSIELQALAQEAEFQLVPSPNWELLEATEALREELTSM